MDILDPVQGGRFRSLVIILSSTYSSLALLLGWSDISVKVSVVIAGAIVGIVELLTHHTAAGNVDPHPEVGDPVPDPTTLPVEG